MQNLRKFRATFFFFFFGGKRFTAKSKICTWLAHAKGNTCPPLATPRHQCAHAKAPTRAACPHQGTNACSFPTPRHQLAHAKAKTCPRLAHAKAKMCTWLAHTKAPTHKNFVCGNFFKIFSRSS